MGQGAQRRRGRRLTRSPQLGQRTLERFVCRLREPRNVLESRVRALHALRQQTELEQQRGARPVRRSRRYGLERERQSILSVRDRLVQRVNRSAAAIRRCAAAVHRRAQLQCEALGLCMARLARLLHTAREVIQLLNRLAHARSRRRRHTAATRTRAAAAAATAAAAAALAADASATADPAVDAAVDTATTATTSTSIREDTEQGARHRVGASSDRVELRSELISGQPAATTVGRGATRSKRCRLQPHLQRAQAAQHVCPCAQLGRGRRFDRRSPPHDALRAGKQPSHRPAQRAIS